MLCSSGQKQQLLKKGGCAPPDGAHKREAEACSSVAGVGPDLEEEEGNGEERSVGWEKLSKEDDV